MHFGSLVAAVGSYLDARSQGGQWLLRIEDVDGPRNVSGAAQTIIADLAAFGFEWDGPVVWQSQRLDTYRDVLATLIDSGQAYGCACSRKDIAEAGSHEAIDGGLAYPGTCRGGLAPGRVARAWRLRVHDAPIDYVDRIQGPQRQHLEQDVGDFVLLRADGQFAYQLAVVIDDAWQGITDVVRGADLLDSTPRQIWLQRCLGVGTPTYAHLPVVTDRTGAKLSKQTLAPPLQPGGVAGQLVAALGFLGQSPPAGLDRAAIGEVWTWALAHWSLATVPRCRGRMVNPGGVPRNPDELASGEGHSRRDPPSAAPVHS